MAVGLHRRLDAWRRVRSRLGSRVRLGVVAGAIGLVAIASPSHAATPSFDDPAPVTSADGALQLSWGDAPGDYEVQLRHGTEIRTTYRGRLPSAHVSGLPDGEYALRVRSRDDDGWSSWSAPKQLTVQHHPMALVWTLLTLGAVVFVGTAAVVLHAAREDA